MTPMKRRDFLRKSLRGATRVSLGAAALASACSTTKTRHATALHTSPRGPNEKVVLALIGAGGRGSGLIKNMTNCDNVETKYVCDVNAKRGGDIINDLEKMQGYAPKRVVDMREIFDDKDVDAAVIATPEHWHALATVWACQAGKDVYVEKNISLTIWEGRKMIEAARKYDRVVQCGTQNRSAPYAFSARDYIKNGGLGRVVHVKVLNMLGGGPWSPQPDGDLPEGLDWDKWLGPAPKRPYNPGRHGGWYSWWEYSGGGSLAGDASHTLDLARMALGDPPHPRSVYCAGGRLAFDDKREIPDMQAITYDYGKFTMTCEATNFPPYMKKSPPEVRYGSKFPDWPQNATRIEIYGTKRMMYLGRHGGGWQALEGDMKVADFEHGYFPDKWHQPNFIDCVRSRQRPNGDVEQGHYSACLVHLANLAYRVGNKQLLFTGETETIANSPEAQRLGRLEYRDSYRVPENV
jgi:predicted dehydrogenase